MSTRVRSLWLEFRAVSLTLCIFDEDTGVGHLPFLSPDSLCTFPSLLCSLQGWPPWAASTVPYSSGLSLGLANGKLWWIFLFPDLPFRDLCSFSVDRLLQCWLPHHLRHSFFGLRMPMTYLDGHSIPQRQWTTCWTTCLTILQLNLPSSTCPAQVSGSWAFSTSHGTLDTCMFQGHCHCSKHFGHSFTGTTFEINLWGLRLPENCSQYSILICSHIDF